MGDPIEHAGRCGSCAAWSAVRTDEKLGRVGNCALEVFRWPLPPTSTCTRYRPVGATTAAPRPRAAGEPRRGGSPVASRSDGAPRDEAVEASPALPQEIDIDMDIDDFRRVLREVLADELGTSRPPLGARWQGGEIVLKPGKEGTQEKRVPIETFFHKIVMVRDKLRVLEAKLNAHPNLSAEDKVQLQAYVTGCYGSMTTFNVLFAEKADQFSGASGKDD